MHPDAALVGFRAPGFSVSSALVTQLISPSFLTLWVRHRGLVSLHILAVCTPHKESKSSLELREEHVDAETIERGRRHLVFPFSVDEELGSVYTRSLIRIFTVLYWNNSTLDMVVHVCNSCPGKQKCRIRKVWLAWARYATAIHKQADSRYIGKMFILIKRRQDKNQNRCFHDVFIYMTLTFLSFFFFLFKSGLPCQRTTRKTLATGEAWNLNFASKIIIPSKEQSIYRHSHNPHLHPPQGFQEMNLP